MINWFKSIFGKKEGGIQTKNYPKHIDNPEEA